MTVEAKVIAHSISSSGKEILSIQGRVHRFVWAEFLTHRAFSRNASSSRAIPVKRLIADVRRDPAIPLHWGANQKGMQADFELTGWRRTAMRNLWLAGMWIMTSLAYVAAWLGAHKQIVNRMIEPWAHINFVVTATEWDNFFALRYHPDAQPEIRELAKRIWEAKQASKPRKLRWRQWHLLYVTEEDFACVARRIEHGGRVGIYEDQVNDLLVKLSVARCARVSYLTHEGAKPSVEADLALYDKLVGDVPLHASPTEHQARPASTATQQSGNFVGWIQYRKTIPNECIEHFAVAAE